MRYALKKLHFSTAFLNELRHVFCNLPDYKIHS